ncbi:MAG: ankyrin repeat domain-containing protein, partial [Chitinophagaceae bacterium]
MPKKKKTLPKDFEDLIVNSDLDTLKRIFDTCELDARGGYTKITALGFSKCPDELANWLVGQGADIHARDSYGNTPLHTRSQSIFGSIRVLLELGANVNDNGSSVGTPLHAAARSHNAVNTDLLITHGADIRALNSDGINPLEDALQTCSNIDIVKTVALTRIYLDAGIEITPAMKERVTEIGKRFEFHKAGFAKDSVEEVSNALAELYRLFSVEPVSKRAMHDGKSPIRVTETEWPKQHQELWDLLVPSSGPCQTIQGEVIRISGRIANELDGNGGINWDDNYRKMADAFLSFLKTGNGLGAAEQSELVELV